MESALCLYETEYEPMGDPYDNREHPFKQQFGNTYQSKLKKIVPELVTSFLNCFDR